MYPPLMYLGVLKLLPVLVNVICGISRVRGNYIAKFRILHSKYNFGLNSLEIEIVAFVKRDILCKIGNDRN